MRHEPTFRAAAVIVAFGGVLSAACATTRYTQSAVVAVPTGVKGEPGSRPSLEIDGLRLRIEPLDRAPRDQAIPSLRLRIVFDPRELGYSFDPGQVVLRSVDGREWRANESGYRSLSPKSSVEVGFDAAVDQASTFDLVLAGLARGEKRLEPVTVRLARRKGLSYDRLYWLEAIGYALALPLAAASGGM